MIGRRGDGWPPPPPPGAHSTAVTARATTSFSISATMVNVWFPASITNCSWNSALATPKCFGVVHHLALLVGERVSFRTSRRRAEGRPDAMVRTAAGSMMLRASCTSPRVTLRACNTSAAVRCGHPLVGFVDDHPAEHSADDGDEPLRLEDAERLAERRSRDAEPLDEIGLVSERVALGQLPADDEGTQLVGDLLRLLARSRRGAPRHQLSLRCVAVEPRTVSHRPRAGVDGNIITFSRRPGPLTGPPPEEAPK